MEAGKHGIEFQRLAVLRNRARKIILTLLGLREDSVHLSRFGRNRREVRQSLRR